MADLSICFEKNDLQGLKTIQCVKGVDILGHYHCCGMSKVKSGRWIEKHVFNKLLTNF
jgi:hypothetical protein